jgi:death on curing protein
VAKRGKEPRWLSRVVVEAVHTDQLREHGGAPGLRDENMLESALARPRQRWRYEPDADLPALAAGYAFGLASNHPFRDGNKRIAFLALVTFLGLNGLELDATEHEVVTMMLRVADGRVTEDVLAEWVRAHIVRSNR